MLPIVLAAILAAGGSGTPSNGAVEILATVTLDFGSINSGATASLTGTINGAEPGDHVTVTHCSDLQANISDLEPSITASNTVSLQVRNFDEVNAIDPAPCAFIFKVTKQ